MILKKTGIRKRKLEPNPQGKRVFRLYRKISLIHCWLVYHMADSDLFLSPKKTPKKTNIFGYFGKIFFFFILKIIISSPGALLQVSLSSYAMAYCPSVSRPSLAFPIIDISSRTINWIELKLSVRHCGRHGSHLETQKFRIAKILPFRYPRWLPWLPY